MRSSDELTFAGYAVYTDPCDPVHREENGSTTRS